MHRRRPCILASLAAAASPRAAPRRGLLHREARVERAAREGPPSPPGVDASASIGEDGGVAAVVAVVEGKCFTRITTTLVVVAVITSNFQLALRLLG